MSKCYKLLYYWFHFSYFWYSDYDRFIVLYSHTEWPVYIIPQSVYCLFCIKRCSFYTEIRVLISYYLKIDWGILMRILVSSLWHLLATCSLSDPLLFKTVWHTRDFISQCKMMLVFMTLYQNQENLKLLIKEMKIQMTVCERSNAALKLFRFNKKYMFRIS